MKNFTPSHFFILVLIFSVVVVPQVNAQKRCEEILYPRGCTLADCGYKCLHKHNGRGICKIIDPDPMVKSDYYCICIYNCPN
ncbi:hypothetical protein ACOSQ4_014138 [Xanthoceras sorbifolium]